MEINQDKESFRKWLRSQPGTATAIAADHCHCWLAEWFESQGVYVWGVFPRHYLERCVDAPGGGAYDDADSYTVQPQSDWFSVN